MKEKKKKHFSIAKISIKQNTNKKLFWFVSKLFSLDARAHGESKESFVKNEKKSLKLIFHILLNWNFLLIEKKNFNHQR